MSTCSCCKRFVVWQSEGRWECFYCDVSNDSPWHCQSCRKTASTASSSAVNHGFSSGPRAEEKNQQSSESKAQGSFSEAKKVEMVDIGANLLDAMFQGVYHGKSCHPADIEQVITRAHSSGVTSMIVTAGTLQDAKDALEFVKRRPGLFTTVGVHPTRASEFEDSAFGGPDAYMKGLLEVMAAGKGKVVAVGECGLDYDRLQFCPKETQLKYFERHFELASQTGLPMFLHNRNTSGDFVRVVRENRSRFRAGVVHSFDGSMEELQQLLSLDLYIGINGCSLKTAANLAVARAVPDHRLMVETDAPWCGIKPSHAGNHHVQTRWSVSAKEKVKSGLVKDRNEPCCLRQVCEILAAIRECSFEHVAEVSTKNAREVFSISDNKR